jgi:peptidoglycan/LPS O-acetylase OafA/YrhL
MTDKRAIGPDILRGLAILLVMSWHMPWTEYPPLFQHNKNFGWLGVDIFFVLSGYLIGTELLKPVQAGRAPDLRIFYLKRAFRILPVFWLILAIYALSPILRERESLSPLWRYLTFTLNFGLDARTFGTFTHAWSLCVEEHFYLILPALVLILRRFRMPWPAIALAASVLVGGMVLRHHIWSGWHATSDNAVTFFTRLYYPSYNRLDGLLIGVCMAALRLFYPVAWARFVRPVLTLPLAALCLGCAGYMNEINGVILSELGSIIFYPLFSLGIAFLLAGLLETERYLQPARSSGLGYIAAISYSLYLSHKIVIHLDDLLLPKGWMTGWSQIAIYYVTSITVASGLYFAVERTFMQMRNRVLTRMKKPSRSPETALNSAASD